MHTLVLASDGWSYGGSILTFLFPMIAFATVALALLILFTKPVLPGRSGSEMVPIIATRHAGSPLDGGTAKSGESASAE